MPQLAVFVGANGTGKSTLFSVFEFLREALTTNVTNAFAKLGGARGLKDVRSRGEAGPIEIELRVEAELTYGHLTPLRYLIEFEEDEHGKPVVRREFLQNTEVSNVSVDLRRGKGSHSLSSPDLLGLKALAQFEQADPALAAVYHFLIGHRLVDLKIDRARSEGSLGESEHLSTYGENLPLVIEHLQRRNPEVLTEIVERLRHRVPGLSRVETKVTEDGRFLLKLQDGAFDEPFPARDVSDGTLMMLAYLVLLLDPNPHPFLCVEEPENHLYPTLLAELAEELRTYSLRGGQVMVTSHSPDFLNAIELDEVYWLVKRNGATEIRRGRDNAQVAAYMADGDKLGYLWKQGFFDDVEPQ